MDRYDIKVAYGAILLIGGLILYLPISNTIEILGRYNHVRELKTTLAMESATTAGIEHEPVLVSDRHYLSKALIDRFTLGCEAHAVKIAEVRNLVQFVLDDVSMQEQQLVLEGPYTAILATMADVVKDMPAAKIVNLSFGQTQVNRKHVLHATITIRIVLLTDLPS